MPIATSTPRTWLRPDAPPAMSRLLSVNVGLPRDITWRGRTVHTGIWKAPVQGRCRLRRLNLEGDGQGDLAGHGGEQRAVFVYQIESYRHWEQQLKRPGLVYGQFGENFTVEGLPDDTVCIGDRYRVGSTLLEVTQPRVTCYRVGIRMDEPRMPALLTASGRPGFYFRVLQEGEVGAGDEIVKVGEARERMTVAEINALLYSGDHPREKLERALRIEALSSGWRASFAAMLAKGAHAGLAPEAAAHAAAPGFRDVSVTRVEQAAEDVLSFTLERADGMPLPAALPGQYIVVRLALPGVASPLYRSYSLCGPVSTQVYRIGVKIEPHGRAGAYLRDHVRVGDRLKISAPRGSFTLLRGSQPVILLSAGMGVTPVLAMLQALAAEHSSREVLWLHAARDGAHHPFAAEARQLLQGLAHGRSHVCYSQPLAQDRLGTSFDSTGRFSPPVFGRMGLPPEADVYLCGPSGFMADMKALTAAGLAPQQLHTELFQGSESLTPGVVRAPARAPHPPEGAAASGPRVSFARSGLDVRWSASYPSILDLAEACDVPVRWSCRTGVCHNCEAGLVSGRVDYGPEPLERPADGNLLICCSRPNGDIVVDL